MEILNAAVAVVGVLIAFQSVGVSLMALPEDRRQAFLRTFGRSSIILGLLTLAVGACWWFGQGWAMEWEGQAFAAKGVGLTGLLWLVTGLVLALKATPGNLRKLHTMAKSRLSHLPVDKGSVLLSYERLRDEGGRRGRRQPGETARVHLIRGAAGSGKSAMLRQIEGEALGKVRRRGELALMPFYMDLRHLPLDKGITTGLLTEMIYEQFPTENDTVRGYARELLHAAHDPGSWLLLVDSFDELYDLPRSRADISVAESCLRIIKDLVQTASSVSLVIVATRDGDEVVQADLGRCTQFQMLPLFEVQQVHIMELAGIRRPEGLLRELRKDPRLRSMTDNPMLLRLLCEELPAVGERIPDGHALVERVILAKLGAQPDLAGLRRYAEDLAVILLAGEQPGRDSVQLAALVGAGVVRRRLSGRVEFAHPVLRDHWAGCWLVRAGALWEPERLVRDPAWHGALVVCLRQSTQEMRERVIGAIAAAMRQTSDEATVRLTQARRLLTMVADGAPDRLADWKRRAGGIVVHELLTGSPEARIAALGLLAFVPAPVAGRVVHQMLRTQTSPRSEEAAARAVVSAEHVIELPEVFRQLGMKDRLLVLMAAWSPRLLWRFKGTTPRSRDGLVGAAGRMLIVLRIALSGLLIVVTEFLREILIYDQSGSRWLMLPLIGCVMFLPVLVVTISVWRRPSEATISGTGVILIAMVAVFSYGPVAFFGALFAVAMIFSFVPVRMLGGVALALVATWPCAMTYFVLRGREVRAWHWGLPHVPAFADLFRPLLRRDLLADAAARLREAVRRSSPARVRARLEAGQMTSGALVTWLRRARGPQELADLICVLHGLYPEALRPVESVLRDLEAALEQVRVMVAPKWRKRVPPLVWAEVEFATPRFRRWLMAWDEAHPAGLGALLRQNNPPDLVPRPLPPT
ncbi:NACHT domain-containing protein [Nonomuraea basaltis]|uniref:NACHT domain-containing protein n=1 Tax=Nonomuraea basaltis TaxID=2495887 RepID=UPI001486F2E2|nr:NACHT domain-containing protein [Nonomuraea basaltis]